MAENSSGEKSEKPTPGKLKKARDKGELPRSKDMTMATLVVASFITISAFFPYYRQLVQESFTSVAVMAGKLDDPGALQMFMMRNVTILFKFLATLLPIPAAAIVASLIPGGWIFSPKKLVPDLKKLNPIQGVKRIFSASHLTDVLKMVAKCIVVLVLLYILIQSELYPFIHLQSMPLVQSINQGLSIYHGALLYFVIMMMVFAVIDIPLSKYLFTKKMKMTKQEVREEYKNNEGNPQIKARIRQVQQQMAMGQINVTVPTADVVITNPTHFAVALKYDPDKAKAPYIVAKGVDDLALYIRDVARTNNIEIVEFPPLARAVYHTTRVNQQIPAQLFRAIAHVLTYVLQLKSWRAGQSEKPVLNKQIVIPKEVMEHDGKSSV